MLQHDIKSDLPFVKRKSRRERERVEAKTQISKPNTFDIASVMVWFGQCNLGPKHLNMNKHGLDSSFVPTQLNIT